MVDVAAGALPGLSHPAAQAFLARTGSVPRPKFGWTDVCIIERSVLTAGA